MSFVTVLLIAIGVCLGFAAGVAAIMCALAKDRP